LIVSEYFLFSKFAFKFKLEFTSMVIGFCVDPFDHPVKTNSLFGVAVTEIVVPFAYSPPTLLTDPPSEVSIWILYFTINSAGGASSSSVEQLKQTRMLLGLKL